MTAELRGCHLHFDCAAGAAGDMVLGALLDLGVPRDVVARALDEIGIGAHRLHVESIVKSGIAATNVTVDASGGDPAAGHSHDRDHSHGHDHDHDHAHEHTHYRDIRHRLESAGLDAPVLALACDIFDRVARAEAKLHGTTVEDVAFHEVGAVDSIVDIVGAAAALAWLAPASVSCSPVAMGHGTVDCAHGTLPVPAPASLEIMRESGGVMADGGVPRELCTPTGAAILSAAVTRWGAMPAMTGVGVGYGAGDADLADRPNVLRVTAGRQPATDDATADMFRVEANVDDMSPEMCEHAAQALFDAGAVDVWWTPISMKKSRPALQLSALAPEPQLDAVVRATLRETTSIGVRFDRVGRRVLQREVRKVDTRFGQIPVKVALLDGVEVNAAPEYEACRAAARAHGAPLKAVFAAAIAAYEQSR